MFFNVEYSKLGALATANQGVDTAEALVAREDSNDGKERTRREVM